METVLNIFGHLHPLLVHLPIGVLLFAILIHGLSLREKYAFLSNALPIAYLIGTGTAILACLTGLILSNSGEYDETILFNHKWLGIAVAQVSLIGLFFTKKRFAPYLKIISLVLLILIFITGHYGGTLTHGEGYITKTKSAVVATKTIKAALTNTQELVLYTAIIQPILEEKCYGCHSQIKQKGKLRLDGEEWILKGGKDGVIIHAGDPQQSALYHNITLDPLEEKHMPPKGKPQITEEERVLLEWWINTGASFNKKIKDLTQPIQVKSILTSLEKNNQQVKTTEVPSEKVGPADNNSISALQKNGVTILPVATNSNYLTANFITLPQTNDTIHSLIKNISPNLIWLKIPGMHFSSGLANSIATCTVLTRLSMEHSTITDNELHILNSLTQLQYLNLVGTKISLKGLLGLTAIKNLKQLYIAQTSITKMDVVVLQKNFPLAKIDFGNYTMEKLATDTQILKAPLRK